MIGNRLYCLCKRVERVRDDKITLLRRHRIVVYLLVYGQKKEKKEIERDSRHYCIEKKEGKTTKDGKEQI